MPQPQKRKAPSLAILVTVLLRQGVPCAHCGERLDHNAFEMDHIIPLDALGGQGADNWQALCIPCHAAKTRIDNARSCKGARLRGEAGPLKRMREIGPLLTSRNDLKGRTSAPLRGRKFNTALTRGMDGIVRPRK